VFARDLARKWEEKASKSDKSEARVTHGGDRMPSGAIFVSYAREDEAIARLLAEGLRAHGCLVWYDRERLRAGSYWVDHLQQAVRRECSVFIALVSDTTETADRGYWRVERDWAIERAPEYYPAEFYVPVSIGAVRPPFQMEPARVRDGLTAVPMPDPASEEFTRFAERLKALQIRRQNPDA